MHLTRSPVLSLATILVVAAPGMWAAEAQSQPVGKEADARWTRWVLPLPHEITVAREVAGTADQVAITLRADAGPLEKTAADELADVLTRQAGTKISVGGKGGGASAIEIVLGVCDKDGKLAGREIPGAARLFALPHVEQAYRIAPLGERTLALVAAQPTGLYYAAKTLKQLIESTTSSAEGQPAAPGRVTIPMADVTDWPDLAERGLWGGNAEEDIEWMADRKMNHLESHAHVTVGADGRGVATISERLLADAKRHAINVVPIITHLEQLSSEVFARCPELKAVGDYATWRRTDPHASPVCFAHPKAEELITDWLVCLGRYADVRDVIVWLSEENVSCQCEKCKDVDPFAQQTQVIVRAWEAAKRTRPDLRLRILLTQGSYASNEQVLAAAPRTVGITYYDGRYTYDSSRKPMIYPLLEKYAAEGGWLGCYPQLTASWRIVCPWTGPQFIKARMCEFTNKRLQSLVGYATPSNRFYEFNVSAAAEWSWNAGGRSERDFAVAWATRQGIGHPEKFADWCTLLGPVGWDVHGGNAMLFWIYNGVSDLFKQEKSQLISGMFSYFPTPESFDADLAICDRAMTLATELQSPAAVAETRVTRGLVAMLKGLYLLAHVTAADEKMTADERSQAAEALALTDRASQETRSGLLAWATAVAPELVPPRGFTSRFADTLQCLDRVVGEASDEAVKLGIPDAGRAFRIRTIGEWKINDFGSGLSQRKTWAANEFLSGPGRYEVRFHRDSRDYNVKIKQVQIVSIPAINTTQETEIGSDRHEGVAGDQPKNNYELKVEAYDPNLSWAVAVDFVGIPADHPGRETGRVGHATIQKVRNGEPEKANRSQ